MTNQKTQLAILGISFIAILTLILMVNRWISQEVNHFEKPPEPPQTQVTKIYKPVKTKPRIINPLNDPLAPIVKKAPSEPRTFPPRQKEPKPFYEMSSGDVILIQ